MGCVAPVGRRFRGCYRCRRWWQPLAARRQARSGVWPTSAYRDRAQDVRVRVGKSRSQVAVVSMDYYSETLNSGTAVTSAIQSIRALPTLQEYLLSEGVAEKLCHSGSANSAGVSLVGGGWMITFAPSLHGIFVVSIDMDNNDDHSRSLVVPLMYRLRFGKSQRTKPFPFALLLTA